MKACRIGKIISCLSVFLVAAVGGSASYPGMAAFAGSDTAPPANAAQGGNFGDVVSQCELIGRLITRLSSTA
jgi:hypothetical protein